MSEQAKIAYLQEKIKEARYSQALATIVGALGGIAAVFGLFSYFQSIGGWNMLSMGIGGVIILVIGIIGIWIYEERLKKLQSELKNIGVRTTKCPSCGKQIPQSDFAFCPFCGTALEK
jgi:flagellar motor component MotA